MDTQAVITKYRDKIAVRRADANKSDYGKLLVIAGSAGMAGAAYLSGLAAFRAGIGMVRFPGPEENRSILQTLLPEAMYTVWPSAKDAGRTDHRADLAFRKAFDWATHIVVGPGLSTDAMAKEKLHFLFLQDLSKKKLVLFDADALNIIAEEGIELREVSSKLHESSSTAGEATGPRICATNVVITPHVGEMARLTGLSTEEILKDPAGTAKRYSAAHGCVTVLKNAVTYISSPSGDVFENRSGHPAMAKAGSGDVLTGVIAGMTAVTGAGVFDAAAAGTYIHGRAGTLAAQKKGAHSVLARDIAENVSEAIKEIENEQNV